MSVARVVRISDLPQFQRSALLFSAEAGEGPACCYIVESSVPLQEEAVHKLEHLLEASLDRRAAIEGTLIGPRREMVSPWSTNAVDIAANVGIPEVTRIECFVQAEEGTDFDPMTQDLYREISATTLTIDRRAEPLRLVSDIRAYNLEMGLALSEEEIVYLEQVATDILSRPLTDAEVFGFAQVNSEHCRHKKFGGTFVIDGERRPETLFAMIKATSKHAPHNIVSAYKDNVAFLRGPMILQFAPQDPSHPSFFALTPVNTVLSLKAETHNYPTQVEPFNGAATGSGGEIRDRMAGGTGSIPLIGTAVYMTAYPRLTGSMSWEWTDKIHPRAWLYQSPEQILIQASNGASDYGNKIGQPLIVGSLLAFEAHTNRALYAFDKPVMLAGGVGYARAEYAQKKQPRVGDKVVVLGGDNYRIGLGGGSVSSVKSGQYSRAIELSAVQRANAEMQKRVLNATRALAEMADNPIVIIHDHGAGGHMNCLSELVEESGGRISLSKLPIGDSTLSAREILSNESQERMGLVLPAQAVPLLERIAARERAPMYVVGEVSGDNAIVFESDDGSKPVDLPLSVLLGSSPRTVVEDQTVAHVAPGIEFAPTSGRELRETLMEVFTLEAVASKDWLTNKVDRSVSGKVARQQCVGALQVPLADVGVVALDFSGRSGIATALGHAPGAGIIDERKGAILSVIESLTNIVWAPLKDGLASVALSANWMWPCGREGESARLYGAVEALSQTAIALGIPVPTGKDSLSMTTKYSDGLEVRSPGTVIVSAAGETTDVRLTVTPDLKPVAGSRILYVDCSSLTDNPLGGSALAQVLGEIGNAAPSVTDLEVFKGIFGVVQELVHSGKLLAGHDVSAGGMLTALCEMAFAGDCGVEIALSGMAESEVAAFLFTEKPALLLQLEGAVVEQVRAQFERAGGRVLEIAAPITARRITLHAGKLSFTEELAVLRHAWVKPSMLFDTLQTSNGKAEERFQNFDKHALNFEFPAGFSGKAAECGIDLERTQRTGLIAAIVREKGTNGDREMAFALHAAGFDVRDVTMHDLMTGDEDLKDVRFVVFPGGFSNSDVLGAGRGWAAAFQYNRRALDAIQGFMARPDTLTLGVCNGCQLMTALGLLYPEHAQPIHMRRNESHKFESAFLNVEVGQTNSILLKGLKGTRLGIWVAHGEGRFALPQGEKAYDIALRYAHPSYPANPNGADFNAAGICSPDGRHLAMMPHLERAILPWQWGYYPREQWQKHEITPWALAFVGARRWASAAL